MPSRHTPAPKPPPREKKRKRLRQRSAKRAAMYAGDDGRAAFVASVLAERPRCQAGDAIGSTLDPPRRWSGCWVRSEDVHEILARSAGGSILDEDNVLAVCRRCHQWIGEYPREAIKLGLRRSRYAGRNP